MIPYFICFDIQLGLKQEPASISQCLLLLQKPRTHQTFYSLAKYLRCLFLSAKRTEGKSRADQQKPQVQEKTALRIFPTDDGSFSMTACCICYYHHYCSCKQFYINPYINNILGETFSALQLQCTLFSCLLKLV